MRRLLFALGVLAGCGDDDPAKAPDLTGVWAVTMRYADGNCPDIKGSSRAAVWTINQEGDGSYRAKVQGEDALPTLTGKLEEGDIVFTGVVEGIPAMGAEWRLKGSKSGLKGRAIETHKAEDAVELTGLRGKVKVDLLCAVIWTVEAKQQGG